MPKTKKQSQKGIRSEQIKQMQIKEMKKKKIKMDKEKKREIQNFKKDCLTLSLPVSRGRIDEISGWLCDEISYSLPHVRGMLNDFTRPIRDTAKSQNQPEPSSQIKHDCQSNFQNDMICYCCGHPIKIGESKQCDHFIPILQMLACITPGTCSKNLYYIHTKCNGIKSNRTLFHLWNHCGTSFYGVKPHEEHVYKTAAQTRIIEVLRQIEFNEKYKHDQLKYQLKLNKQLMKELIKDMELSFNYLEQARLLLLLQNNFIKNEIYEIEQNSQGPSVSESSVSRMNINELQNLKTILDNEVGKRQVEYAATVLTSFRQSIPQYGMNYSATASATASDSANNFAGKNIKRKKTKKKTS